MADGTVGVRQDPSADRLIDNEVVTNELAQTVYRQKVAVAAPLPAGTNVIGYVSSTVSAKIAVEAKGQVIGGEVTTDIPEPDAFLSIENPSASGVNVVVFGVTLYTDATTAKVRYIRNFTSDTNTQATNPIYFNTYGWGAAVQAVIRFGKTPITGGTTLSPRSQLTNQVPFALRDVPIIIGPGSSFAVKVTGAPSGSLVLGNVYWWEDAV